MDGQGGSPVTSTTWTVPTVLCRPPGNRAEATEQVRALNEEVGGYIGPGVDYSRGPENESDPDYRSVKYRVRSMRPARGNPGEAETCNGRKGAGASGNDDKGGCGMGSLETGAATMRLWESTSCFRKSTRCFRRTQLRWHVVARVLGKDPSPGLVAISVY